jgi:hypothetical protein
MRWGEVTALKVSRRPALARGTAPAFDFDQVLRQQAGVTARPKLLYLDRTTMRRTRTERINDRPAGTVAGSA